MAGEVMDPAGQPNIVNLLNQYDSQLNSKYLFLYPQVNVALTHTQKIFFAAGGCYYRMPQLIKMLRTTSSRMLSPSCCISNTTLIPKAQGTTWVIILRKPEAQKLLL